MRPGQIDSLGVKGMFDIIYYAHGGGRTIRAPGARHHLHPAFVEDPSLLKKGTFYTLTEFELERQARMNSERQRLDEKKQEQLRLLKERVVGMAEQGIPVQEIAAHAEIGAPMVEEILYEWRQQHPQSAANSGNAGAVVQ